MLMSSDRSSKVQGSSHAGGSSSFFPHISRGWVAVELVHVGLHFDSLQRFGALGGEVERVQDSEADFSAAGFAQVQSVQGFAVSDESFVSEHAADVGQSASVQIEEYGSHAVSRSDA